MNYILESDNGNSTSPLEGHTYFPWYGTDYHETSLQSANSEVYWQARRQAESAGFERAVDNVIALTDSSDLFKIPSNEQIQTINYNLDEGSLLFQKSGIRIFSILHYVFVFRLFINNFATQSSQLGGVTTRVSIPLAEFLKNSKT